PPERSTLSLHDALPILWAWSLAIPSGSKKVDAAQKFVTWATSKEYIELVGKTNGWGTVPTGTRKSTYANADFLKAARFANAEKIDRKSTRLNSSHVKIS